MNGNALISDHYTRRAPNLSKKITAQSLLTSIVCKIGEKIVFDRLHKFWQETGLINNNQFGFLKGRSTVTQLLSSLNDLAKPRNLSHPTDVVFLDLAKAFDSVPHERLLLKLKSNGIDGCLHAWLRHFLTGRRQRVILRPGN